MAPNRTPLSTLCLMLLFLSMVLFGYLFMIHEFASKSSPYIDIETKTIVIAAQNYIEKYHMKNEDIADHNTEQRREDVELQRHYLSRAIHSNKYVVDDFSFYWTSGDGSPLFMNASKYDTNGDIGYSSFVFCPMPKNGCSAWKQVLRRLKGDELYLADDYWSLHSSQNNLEQDRIHRFGVDGANNILYEPNTIHAVFVRDSIERSLSAFLDKCVGSHWQTKYWCRPRTDRNNKIKRKIYSHFDLYIDAIVNKPSDIALDFHWGPQHFVCDLYKFVGRYNVYHSNDIDSRYQFLYDIGGNKTWNKIGAHGWLKKQHERRLLLRRGPIQIMGKNATEQMEVLDLNGSFLDKESYHTIHAAKRLLQFYRADLLAKVVAYYESDYVLFNMTLPPWICNFLDVTQITDMLTNGADYFDKHWKDIDMLSYGEYAIYHKDYDHDAIVNESGEIWNRKDEIAERMKKYNTFIDMFFEMMHFDDKYGTITNKIRGIAALSNILSFVDLSILPPCFTVDDWAYTALASREEKGLTTLIDTYFNLYLNSRKKNLLRKVQFVGRKEKKDDKYFINAKQIFDAWREQDKILYHNIQENVLWMREIPRKALWRRFNK